MSLRFLRVHLAAIPFRILISVALFFAVASVPVLAHAQAAVTVMILNKDSLPRYSSTGDAVTKRTAVNPEGVNLPDCQADQRIGFPLNVAGFSPSDSFEVWVTDVAGVDCTQPTARTGATAQCYRVDANFGRQATQTVTIPVKTLIKGLSTNGTTPTLDADGCRLVSNYTYTVYFMVLRGSTNAGADNVAIKVSTQGPRALSNVRALPGDRGIVISWDSVGEGGAEDVQGAQAFCDPMPMQSTSTDAGTRQECTDADAEADGEAGPEPSCMTVANEAGTPGDPIPTPQEINDPSGAGKACKTQAFTTWSKTPTATGSTLSKAEDLSSTTGNSIRITTCGGKPLENGVVYAVAVAPKDSFGNIGELSDPICQWPEATSDFWREYRGAGGQAGGSFCSIEGPGYPIGSFTLMSLGIIVGISTLRRVKRIRARVSGRSDR